MITFKNKLTIAITFLSLFYTVQSFGWVQLFSYQEGKQIPAIDGFFPGDPHPFHIDPRVCQATTSNSSAVSDQFCYTWFTVPSDADFNGLNAKVDANFKTLSDKIVTSQTVIGNKVASYVHSMLIRDGSVAGTQTANDLRDLIQTIVKEEIQKALEDQK